MSFQLSIGVLQLEHTCPYFKVSERDAVMYKVDQLHRQELSIMRLRFMIY